MNGLSIETMQVAAAAWNTIGSWGVPSQAIYWEDRTSTNSPWYHSLTIDPNVWNQPYVTYSTDPATGRVDLVKDVPEWDS